MSTQKQPTNCTNSTNSSISEIREISEPAPKISVIVPVYKVEKYLPECIESVLAQTFTDFELILVDDGSPDNSGAICDAYAARDPRIRVFHKENGGVSSARNLGLDHARGEWIAFVDSDDWLEPRMYEMLYQTATNHAWQIVWCNFYRNTSFKKEYTEQPDDFLEKNAAIEMFFGGKLSGACWNKLYRRDFIEAYNIRFFEECRMAEDFIFNVEIFLRCPSTEGLPIALYHYYQNDQGAVSRYLKTPKENWEIVLNQIEKRCIEENIDVRKHIVKKRMTLNFTAIRYCTGKPSESLIYPIDWNALTFVRRVLFFAFLKIPFRCFGLAKLLHAKEALKNILQKHIFNLLEKQFQILGWRCFVF